MPAIEIVPNLIQGISQQAPHQNFPSQCRVQYDCINSPLNGCVARPPAELVRVWPGRSVVGADGAAFFHEVVRGAEHYLVGSRNGELFAIDLADGTDCSISYMASPAYLGQSQRSLRATTVDDTIFIVNRDVAVQAAQTVSPPLTNEGLVFVRGAAFSATYSVTIWGGAGSFSVWFTTPSSDNSSAATQATTSNIANQLRQSIAAHGGYTAEVIGSTIRIRSAQDFTIETSDGNGDDYLYGFKGSVQSFSRLPRRAFDGFTLKVLGEGRTEADDYWVRYSGESTTGRWIETCPPSVPTRLEPSTLPHTLVLTGYRQFSFRQPGWSSRVANYPAGNGFPSFLYRPLRDVFYHSGRLGLLHEAGCVWSKARFPYTFFPDTAQAALASAPIDILVSAPSSSKGAALLDFAVQVDEALHLWAPRAQFRITSGNETFRQDSVEARPTTAFEYIPQCDPVAVGSQLYVATASGRYATVRSLEFQQGRVVGEIDVTAHVPNLVAAGVKGLAPSDTMRTLFIYSDSDEATSDTLYVYNYLIKDRELQQSAWNLWRIPGGKIMWAGVRNSQLILLQQREEGLALLKVNLMDNAVDPAPADATYRTRLDLLVTDTMVSNLSYDAANNRSSFTLPYTIRGDIRVVIRTTHPYGGNIRGHLMEVVAAEGNSVTVKGDLRNQQFYAGHPIVSERIEHPLVIKDQRGVIPSDRLTVARFILDGSQTGFTRVEVTDGNGTTKSETFNSRVVGAASGTTGTPRLSDFKLNVPVGHSASGATIRLVNDSFLPSRWQSASYEYEAVGLARQR